MWSNAVITDAGKAIMEQWAAGGTLEILRAYGGTGTVDASKLREQTSLVSPKQALSIKSYSRSDEGVTYKISLTAASTAYTCNQIGIQGRIAGSSYTIIALYQDETGIQVPSKTEMPNFSYTFYAIVASDNDTGTLTVQTKPGITAVDSGGTGADNAADALTNLGIFYADTLPSTGTEGQICLIPES